MFIPLDELTARHRSRVGGKAWNCGRLRRAGFPVPDGMVLAADAPDGAIAQLLAHRWFGDRPAGALFAVRSSGVDEDSAGHSFAGVHQTELNVPRADLPGAVRRCRESARSGQAEAYRAARGLGGHAAGVAVLVQPMVSAISSGVAFTINPVSGADEIVINGSHGVGDALVSGRIDPDEYIVRKSDRSVRSVRVGAKAGLDADQASLSPPQIAALTDLVLRIEHHYGTPQDIEWCWDGSAWWILQSRTVTTRNLELRTLNSEPGTLNSEPRTPNPDPEWTRANVVEVLPDQMSPQAMDTFVRALEAAERQAMGALFAPEAELGRIVEVFHGRFYFNLSQLRRVTAIAGRPASDLMRSLGHSEAIAPEDETPVPVPFAQRLRLLPTLVRVGLEDLRAKQLLRKHEQRTAGIIARFSARDPRALSDAEIVHAIAEWVAGIPNGVQIVFVTGAVMMREGALRRICDRVGMPFEQFVLPVLAAGAPSVSAQQAYDLVRVAQVARRDGLDSEAFRRAFDRFLSVYGHRGRYESDWSLPRYREDPSCLLFAIRGHLERPPEDPDRTAERVEAGAAAAWRAFDARLSFWQRLTLRPRARSLLRRLKWQYGAREQVRSDLTRVLAAIRPWFLVLADRFAERGWIDRRDDFFLLTLDEVAPIALGDARAAASARSIVRRRAEQLEAERPLRMPLLMRESQLESMLAGARRDDPPSLAGSTPGFGEAREQRATSNELRLNGLCVSPGVAEGEVVVMRDPSEFGRMKPGAILVAPATDPAWTPLFTLAAGVIVEVGGILSHASTIAREYGLPALANVKDATRILTSGDNIRLNATGGFVERLR